MHLFMHPKKTFLFRSAAIVAIVCITVVGSLFLHTSPTHASSVALPQSQQVQTYSSVTKGTITPAGIADPRHPSQTATQASSTKQLDKHVRSIPRSGQTSAISNQVNASDFPLSTTSLLQNFNGVSSLDSAVTNFGAEFEPPDQGLCVGNGFVLEAVNSAFTITHTDGSVVLGPLNVNVLFNEGLREFTSDPRCYFDKSTNTWIAIILFINDTNTESRTDIAINNSGDPTTPWTVYHLDATDDGTNATPNHPTCPCLGDQPLLGLDSENVYISTNEFALVGPGFNGAQIYALSKSQIFSLGQSVNFVHFDKLKIGNSTAASVQPAITNGYAGAGFFLNSLDPQGNGDNRIGAWALTNRQNVSQGGFPTLSSIVVTSESYGIPPAAIQQGSSSLLDAGDDRMQQVEFINGDLWGALGTTVTIPNDTTTRAGIAWFRVHPSVSQALISDAEISSQGYLASLGNSLLYPAIQANKDNAVTIGFSTSGANNFPSAAFATMPEGSTSFGDIHIVAAGIGFYNQGGRWGDYSWATLDPDLNHVWIATEYIPPVSSQTPDGIVNWGTRVYEVNGQS